VKDISLALLSKLSISDIAQLKMTNRRHYNLFAKYLPRFEGIGDDKRVVLGRELSMMLTAPDTKKVATRPISEWVLTQLTKKKANARSEQSMRTWSCFLLSPCCMAPTPAERRGAEVAVKRAARRTARSQQWVQTILAPSDPYGVRERLLADSSITSRQNAALLTSLFMDPKTDRATAITFAQSLMRHPMRAEQPEEFIAILAEVMDEISYLGGNTNQAQLTNSHWSDIRRTLINPLSDGTKAFSDDELEKAINFNPYAVLPSN
jgi:hypothetical protein